MFCIGCPGDMHVDGCTDQSASIAVAASTDETPQLCASPRDGNASIPVRSSATVKREEERIARRAEQLPRHASVDGVARDHNDGRSVEKMRPPIAHRRIVDVPVLIKLQPPTDQGCF
jgi:hypothetical protein